MITTPPVRGARPLQEPELRAAATKRLNNLAARYGADSDQVKAALTRWGRILADHRQGDDTWAAVQNILEGAAR